MLEEEEHKVAQKYFFVFFASKFFQFLLLKISINLVLFILDDIFMILQL